jgi:hypothetical protein
MTGGEQSEAVTAGVVREQSAQKAPSLWRHRYAVAGPLALAGAMVIYMMSQRAPSLPDLPAYSVTATAGDPAAPGASSTHLRLPKGAGARDARFELALRPTTPPVGKVVAYAFALEGTATEPAPLDAKIEIAADGAVRLTGRSRALEGAREIRVVVGEPAAIGKFVDAAERAAANKGDEHVHVASVPIDRE